MNIFDELIIDDEQSVNMDISVCLCSYNSEKYILAQVQSILEQLKENDEIIIFDDCSTDLTYEIISSIRDARIKLQKNSKNLGIIQNFNECIKSSSKDIIFLSDQDDIWLPQKVEKVINVFQANPEITLVLSDAQVIDGDGNLIASSHFQLMGGFNPGVVQNIVKNKYHGCTMAFKREMLDFILPLPKDIPMHDMWIGIINQIYGKSLYIEEPLIQYRRHSTNSANPYRSTNIINILIWRYRLVQSLIMRLLKIK